MGGPMSLSSNLRTKRSAQWVNNEGYHGQHFNSGPGPSPIYRGKYSSGAMTPELGGGGGGGGMGLGTGTHGRRNLGFAGLRGYIGSGYNRQRTSGGSTANRHSHVSDPPTGYFTPLTSGQLSAHGLSAAVLGQGGVGSSGIMPREPAVMHSSSMATAPSVPNAADQAGSARREVMRKLTGGHRNSPSVAVPATTPSMPPQPPLASASPQRSQPSVRHSPSVAVWSSYKDGNVLSTIKDNDDANESAEQSRTQSRRNSSTAVGGGRFSSEPLPVIITGPAAPPLARDMVTPFSDDMVGRSYWTGTEPPSARSHSSLGTIPSLGHVHVEEEKEEEIEEAPQPMELDVATYMVGGVAAGKRMRRILSGPTDRARVVREGNRRDDNVEYEFDLNEMISLVTMDGVVCCFDPARKVSHFVGLASKDPVLGIWKVKMHEEVCNPSPLETMLQDGNINVNQEFGIQLLSSTPAKRIYRRIGLSHRDLLLAAHYSVFIEDRVTMVNQLEQYRRIVARRRMKKLRSQTRLNYELPGDRVARGAARRTELSPGASRYNTLSRVVKYGLNGARLRDNFRYQQRVGRAVRNFGTHIRDFATNSSTQPSVAESSVAAPYVTPNVLTDDDHLDVQPSELTTPGMSFSPAVRRLSATPRVQQNPSQQSEQGRGRTGSQGNKASCSDDSTDDKAAAFDVPIDAGSSAYGIASSAEKSSKSAAAAPFLPDSKLASKSLGTDIAAALTGWYGENRDDYRRALRVCDHLVVSTWRGSTYFVDVGTVLDIAHYNDLFNHNWSMRQAAVNEAATAAAAASVPAISTSEKDGLSNIETHSTAMSSLYGNLSEFYDVTGLLSRMRNNASVIQFKFQDTVSAFLADTYAPATGGPNVPCIFYVDYKDRIWAYYHLDEIAEMDDVYGATWFRDEPESLHTPESKSRAIMSGIDTTSYDKPFSVADLAHRRMNMEPWMPLPSETAFSSLVSFSEPNYPYSARTWRKHRVDSSGNNNAAEHQDGNNSSAAGGCNNNNNSGSSGVPRGPGNSLDEDRACSFGGGRVFDSSDNSTPPFALRNNANISGRFHTSYLPGPYLCPIWSDINSVDLYDVGVCNLIELATPELLVFKDIFCKDLGIDASTINEKVNLASIPGLANWVRNCLFLP
ncbi:hypothetical protein GGI21_002108 [Coemansia aciculifera]|nr:hypothetical protein GGI21_002108 [Coemansia aciculifera]